jgi:hypothetical protein
MFIVGFHFVLPNLRKSYRQGDRLLERAIAQKEQALASFNQGYIVGV